MTGPIVAHCGVVTLDVVPTFTSVVWAIYHCGEEVGALIAWPGGAEASVHQTSVTRPTVEEAAVRLAQLLNDTGWVPSGVMAR